MPLPKRRYRVSTRINLETESQIVALVECSDFDRSDIVRLALDKGLPHVAAMLAHTTKPAKK